jgi:HEAT repeats
LDQIFESYADEHLNGAYYEQMIDEHNKEQQKYYEEEIELICTKTDPLIAELRNGSIAAVDKLIQNWLSYEEYGICGHVAEELGKASSTLQIIESKLLEELQSNAGSERSYIISALSYLKKPSGKVVQTLATLLHDEDIHVRSTAAEALGNLDHSHDFISAQLLNSLKDVHASDLLFDESNSPPYQYHPNFVKNFLRFNPEVFKALVRLSKTCNLVTPKLACWIEQHQGWVCFEQAVDALWEMVEK